MVMKKDPVKKNMDKFHKPKTHKDKTKYDRKSEIEYDESDDLEDAKVVEDEYRKLNEFISRGI